MLYVQLAQFIEYIEARYDAKKSISISYIDLDMLKAVLATLQPPTQEKIDDLPPRSSER